MFTWDGKQSFPELGGIDIFDSETGKTFINDSQEVTYEPPQLKFFSDLITLLGDVSTTLAGKKSAMPNTLPELPVALRSTAAGQWLGQLSAKNKNVEVDTRCVFSEANQAELDKVRIRLLEPSPQQRAATLRQRSKHLLGLHHKSIQLLGESTSLDAKAVVEKGIFAKEQKLAAEVTAKVAFNGVALDGVGSVVWKALWEAAREYSIEYAYPSEAFPYTEGDSHCVLCQQQLDDKAKKRLASFEEFVQGTLEQKAQSARSQYEDSIASLPQIPSAEELNTILDAIGMTDELTRAEIIEFFDDSLVRRKAWLESDSIPIFEPPLDSFPWIEQLKIQADALEAEATVCDEDVKNSNRDVLIARRNELEAAQWLNTNKAAIKLELERLKKISIIDKAISGASTSGPSRKKGQLAESLVTGAYIARFNEELMQLGARHIRVELIKSKVTKGRVLHKLQLKGASNQPLKDVLSEGEQRIIAIASFLADVAGKEHIAPFIFDDPITSLDNSFEDATVKRLVELSKQRQVIIFTHRLSLVANIRHFAKAQSVKPSIISIRANDNVKGQPADMLVTNKEIKGALHTLKSERCADLQRAESEANFDECDRLAKSISSDFRVVIERCVEEDLINGVVQRYQRSISTQKLKSLEAMEVSDIQLLDSLMTKYSTPAHAQTAEVPAELPSASDIATDIDMLAKWRTQYKQKVA